VRARNLTFCGEAANSLAGFARERIFASGACRIQQDSSPFFSRPERLFALAFGTGVRAGTHSRRLRRLIMRPHQASLRSSLFRFLSGKRESREGSGTEVTKKFSLAPCVRATWLSLSPAKRKRKRLLRRLPSGRRRAGGGGSE